MTKKELVRIIREVVKRELKNVLTENKIPVQPKKKKQFTSNTMLNEVLNSTEQNYNDESEWPEVNANSLRAQFMGMQDNAIPVQTDLNNRPVDVAKLDPSVGKALTRDYSELVKKFK